MKPKKLHLEPGRTAPKKPAGRARKVQFLVGPIPWDWLSSAAKLPGKAFHVSLALWHVARLTKSRKVKLQQCHLRSFGIGRRAVSAGLTVLEGRGLIGLEKKPGSRPMVTILDRDDSGR